MVRLRAYRPQWLAVALVAGTVAGIALGALQVASVRGRTFAMVPLCGDQPRPGGRILRQRQPHGDIAGDHDSVSRCDRRRGAEAASMQRYSAVVARRSGAAHGRCRRPRAQRLARRLRSRASGARGKRAHRPAAAAAGCGLWVVGLAVLLVVGAVIGARNDVDRRQARSASMRRARSSRASEILSTTSRALRDFMPFGSGLGSFQSVYQLYEKPDAGHDDYVVHAHNDYVELALELGRCRDRLDVAVPRVVDSSRLAGMADCGSGAVRARGGDRVGRSARPQPRRFPAAHRGDRAPASACVSRCSPTAAPLRRRRRERSGARRHRARSIRRAGEPSWIRTSDLLIKSQLLYRLSYGPTAAAR